MQATISQGVVTQSVRAIDTASIGYGNMDGVTLCGPRSYTISPTSYSFLDLTTDTLTLQSVDPAEATSSPIIITVSATLDNYPLISASSQTFTIEIIDLCATTSLDFNPLVTDMQATIHQGSAT